MVPKIDAARVLDTVTLMTVHEIDVLARHWQLARQSWPSLKSFRHGYRRDLHVHRAIRRELWGGLRRDLSQS